jgi:hypothetical protein
VGCEDNRGAVRSELVVQSAYLKLLRDAFSKHCSWDFDSEIFLVLCCFFSCAIDQCAAIWNHAVADTADLPSDVVDPLVGAGYHHFVVNDLLCTEDDAILANHSEDGATVKCKLTKELRYSKILIVDNFTSKFQLLSQRTQLNKYVPQASMYYQCRTKR